MSFAKEAAVFTHGKGEKVIYFENLLNGNASHPPQRSRLRKSVKILY